MPVNPKALVLASAALAILALDARVGVAQPRAANKPIDAQKAACASTYERAQEERIKKRLKAAKADLVVCGATTCPSAMQRECITWLAEVEAATPSVVLHATSGGREIADVRVLVDGNEVAASLDGGALTLDPGAHKFRFEHAGDEPIEEDHVLVEGQKLTAIDVRFGVGPAAPPKPMWPVWIALGVGAAGIASFAAFGTAGVVQYQHLKSTCAPNCPPSDSSSVKTRFAVADVSLGIGVVGAGVAAALFLTRRAPPADTKPTALRVNFGAAPGTGFAELSTTF